MAQDTIFAPRMIARPSDRFSSLSIVWPADAPGAPAFVLRLTLRNSSQSASTMFMCCAESAFPPNAHVYCPHLIESKHLSN